MIEKSKKQEGADSMPESQQGRLLDNQQSPATSEQLAPKKPRKNIVWRSLLVIGICALLFLLLFTLLLPALRGKNAAGTLQYHAIVQGDFSISIAATGTIQSDLYNVNFTSAGKIAEIIVKPGQEVKKGQVLAKLDTTLLQDAVNEAQNNVNQVKNGGSNEAINLAQAKLRTSQDTLDAATLKAPHDGTVALVNGVVGSLPTGSAEPFIQIVDNSAIRVVANVNEADLPQVKLNDAAQFTVSAYPNRTFAATVSALVPRGTDDSNIITYKVTLTVDMQSVQNAQLVYGMTTNVTISAVQHHNSLLLPTTAISFARSMNVANNPLGIPLQQFQAAEDQAKQLISAMQQKDQDKADFVAGYVLLPSTGTPLVKPVVLGLTDGTSYEVVEGLATKDSVIVGRQEQGAQQGNG